MNKYVGLVKCLFEWNQNNLVKEADLQKEELSNFFATKFLVNANGRKYDGNHNNYFEFLNQFRSTIHSISYSFGQEIIEGRSNCYDKSNSGRQGSF